MAEKKQKPVKKETKKKKVVKKTKEETSEKVSELISRKKVVYAEIDDEVTSLFDKIKPISAKHVYIVAPKRAIIFQSIVNLKILQRKSQDLGKKVYFITNDKNGIYLAQQLGIPVYDKANSEGKPSLFSAESEDDKLRITPLRATVNSLDETAPSRMKEKKLSISEILKKNKGKNALKVKKMDNALSVKNAKKKKNPKFVLVAPNRHALIGLISVSMVILLVIVYIALPGVTVHLVPSASVLEKSVNITLADFEKNRAELEIHPQHMIASYPIDVTVTETVTHQTTGKKFSDKGSNSSGKLTIYNSTNIEWPLIPRTRFQTDEGIVFRIADYAYVPAASNDGPGTVEVFVTADQVDAYEAVIGERGNIGPSTFFLPGLKESSRSKIYAKSSETMTGGVTDFVSFVSDVDIEAAETRVKEELLKKAVGELDIAVAQKTDLLGGSTTFTLLDGDGAVRVGEVSVEVPQGIEGREVSEFTVSGEVHVSGVYYDRDAMLEILKNELLLKKSPQKELLRINEDSTSYRIFDWDDFEGKIKLTANIKGIEQFEIDPDKENGERLLNKIREHIGGMDIDNAKQFIQNLPEINKVEIESWPAWAPTIPNLPENIEFEIKEAITVQ